MSGRAHGPRSSAAPTITINGAPFVLLQPSTLADLIGLVGETPEAIATAVNACFVPRRQRHTRVLRDGDAVSCIRQITGG